MLHAGRRHTAHPVRKPTKRLHGRINHYVRRELVPSTQTKQDRRKYGQPVCTNCKISKRVFPWVFTRNRLTTRPFDRASVTRDFWRCWAERKKVLGFFFSYFFFVLLKPRPIYELYFEPVEVTWMCLPVTWNCTQKAEATETKSWKSISCLSTVPI